MISVSRGLAGQGGDVQVEIDTSFLPSHTVHRRMLPFPISGAARDVPGSQAHDCQSCAPVALELRARLNEACRL